MMSGGAGHDGMRIAQVAPAGLHPYSGIRTVITQLSAHLARRGHDVEIWQLHPWTDEEVLLHQQVLGGVGIPLVPGRFAALAARDVDVVHLHATFTVANNLLAARLRRPYVISPHGGYSAASIRARRRLRKRLYAMLVERRTLRRAALRVVLTEGEAEDLRSLGVHEPVEIIPNGVTRPSTDVDAIAFRSELGLGPDDALLVYTGRVDLWHKGLDLLVRGAAEASEWHAAIVGPDFRDSREPLRRLVETLGAQHRVVFTGPRRGHRLDQVLAAANLFAHTSRWEGLPISLLEALSHGVPALVSPAVDRAVGVAAAGAGWVVEPERIGQLLRELAGLDRAAWRAYADAARRLAARFDWEEVAARYETAYELVLKTSRGRP
jgi:glycosyltransferase involved in cell wall biosynthesis